MVSKQIIVALDNQPDLASALALARQLDANHCRLKIGLELYVRCGAGLVEQLQQQGFEIFLDLKFHDIPNTVAKACQAAAELGVWMINVHAMGGRDMLIAARDALSNYQNPPLLIAVSILTSLDQDDLYAAGLHGELEENVLRLARLAHQNSLDGLVCSAHELQAIRAEIGDDFALVTPGIRPAGSDTDDQKRVMTPQQALQDGANYLVIGRPITQAVNPAQALATIVDSL